MLMVWKVFLPENLYLQLFHLNDSDGHYVSFYPIASMLKSVLQHVYILDIIFVVISWELLNYLNWNLYTFPDIFIVFNRDFTSFFSSSINVLSLYVTVWYFHRHTEYQTQYMLKGNAVLQSAIYLNWFNVSGKMFSASSISNEFFFAY